MENISHTRLIETTVFMPPEHLSKDWKKHLFDHVVKQLVGKCTMEHGYITHVKKICKLLRQHITRTDGSVLFSVVVRALVIRPHVGDKIDVVVEMIFPHGTFCYYRMIRMMLPISKCPGFLIKQDFSMTFLSHRQHNLTIRKSDTIPVIIEDVRYENNLYSCIVRLDLESLKSSKGIKQEE